MKKFILTVVVYFCFFSVYAAYLKDVPKTLTQPDGTVLHCFASGDEYFNYLHDENGYTIMQHPQTGYYVYADKRGNKLVATDFVAGSVDPASKNLRPYNLISPQEWQARRNAWHENDRHVSSRSNPNHGTLNNISIFIRFSDDGEFVNSYSSIDNMFNDVSENGISMRNYFRSASYGSIEIPTYFYPGHSGETIISYQDTYPRSYFQPYNAAANPNGYQNDSQRAAREFGLLERAVNYVNANYPIPTDLNIDYDSDGYVDNVCFIVRGDVGEWNTLLWPHKWAIYDRDVYINGKIVWTFNFQLAESGEHYFSTSTMCHEMNHSLGAPDLYHYSYTGPTPVGIWDLMQNNTTPPQHCGAYMKMKYGHWIDEIPEITEGGVYTLNPISSPTPDNVAYKIATEDPYQFYVVEYRDKTSLFESGLPGSGLLVYRIDTRFDGNADYDPSSGIYDEVYIFRPGGSTTMEGNLSSAYFSANSGRTEFSASTSAYPFFTNGTIDNNFRIYNITEAGNTISFSYGSVADCDPPTNLMASVENNDVVLSWTAAVGAVSYNVYRNGSLIGNTTETSYLDGSPVFGTQNYYVKSMDSNGFLSSASESVEVNYEPEGTVFIGDGGTATNVYLPSYSYYCYTLSQQIYTAEEIGTQGSIRSISFYNDGAEKTRNYDIYLVATDKTAFQNNTDWIPVTTSDLVFSGDVLMAQGWNTITLDVPFGYMGDSNLALIVDDNTGSYTGAPHMACRVFETDEVQAMRIYHDTSNYDPFNPYSYSGTRYMEKNQIVLIVDQTSSTPVVIPETCELGYRPNGAWVRPFTFEIYNPGGYCVINSISTDNDYFQLEEVEMPIILGPQTSREISIATGNGDGATSGHLIINYGDNEIIQVGLSAFAFSPVEPDVWEMARVVDDPSDYRDTPTTAMLNNDYFLPPTDVAEGNDAVYKVTFDHDVLLNGTVTKPDTSEPAENGKLVVYREGFEGVGGPDLENYYSPAIIGEPLELTAYPDGSATTGYLPMYGFYADAYTRSQYVIPATEIAAMAGCPINSLTYYTASTPANWNTTFKVYLTEVNFTSMTNFIDPATATTVYTGALSIVDGQMVVTFDTPYQYNGGNLLIGMDCLAPGTYSSCYFQAVAMTGAGLYAYNYSTPVFTSGNTVNYIPTTTFYCAPSYDPEHFISDMTIASGTYYIAASSTEDEWDVVLNTGELPCPEVASHPTPADYDTDVTPTATQLQWWLGERTTEYQLLLGTDYENLNVVVDWTRDLSETFTVTGLLNNANYFWQVVERNDGCPEGVESPVWGFTTLLNGPQDLYALDYDLYEGDDLTLEWTPFADTNILSYNIYQDNVLIGNTTDSYYTVSGLTYNMDGYNFHVTAVYAGGESNPSNGVGVWVSGNGAVEGHVYEVDGITGIANATVTISGRDEFDYSRSNTFITDANGYYAGTLSAGNYSAMAVCGGYQESRYNNVVNITYNETTSDVDIVMDEVFYPVSEVVAEYYPDATDPNSPYVKVYWSMNSSNWLYYDDGVYQNRVGRSGGQFYWGVMFPAGSYSGNSVTKVSMYDCETHTGNIMIYQGGTTAPVTLLYTQAYSCTGIGDFVEWTMNSPVAIDPSQSLWIVMHNDNGAYPAAGCASTGDLNGRWISLDGSTWEDVASYDLNYTWMLRAIVSNRRGETATLTQPASVNHTMPAGNVTLLSDPNATPHFVGTPAQANGNNRSFNHYRVYRTDAYNNGPYTEDNTVLLADDVTDTLFIDVTWPDADAGIYKYGVSRVYEGNRESAIEWGDLQPNNMPLALMNREPIYPLEECSAGPAPVVNVPKDTNLPVLRGDDTDCIIVQGGSDFGHFTLNNPAEVFPYGFYIDEFTQSACYYNGTYYFANSSGRFGIFYPETGFITIATDRPFGLIEYNPADGKMYGISFGNYANLYEVNPADGSYTLVNTVPSSYALTFTITGEGRFIVCDAGDDCIKEYDPVTGDYTILYAFDWDINYGQDMAMDFETGMAYWAAYNNTDQTHPLIKLDLNVGTFDIIGYFTNQASAFANATVINGIQGDRESPIVWSNFVDKNMNLGEGAVDISVSLNSGDSPEGVTVSFTNLNPAEQQLNPVAPVTLDGSGYYAWDSFRKGDYQVQVSFDDYNTITENVSIWDATALNYVLSEINYGLSNLYVSRTGWAMWTDEQHGNTVPSLDVGDAFFVDFEDSRIPDGWTTIDADGDGYNWMLLTQKLTGTGSGHNGSNDGVLSQSFDNNNGVLYPDNYFVSPQCKIVDGSTFSFWACAQDASYGAEHFGVAISTTGNTSASDFTTIFEHTITSKGGRQGGERDMRAQSTWKQYAVDLSAYAGQQVYIAIRHFNCYDQFYLDVDDIQLTNGAKANRHFDSYQVELSDSEDNVIYQGAVFDCFMQLPVDDLIDGQTYHLKVASVYSSGMSEWSETDWVYQSCDNFETVANLNMEMNDDANVISWTYPAVEDRSVLASSNAFVCNNDGGDFAYGWNIFDVNDINNYTSLNSNLRLYGGDYCNLDGYIYATYENNWNKIDHLTGEIVDQGYLGFNFYDCAWDYSSLTMFAVNGYKLYVWNLAEHTCTYIGSMGMEFEVLACDLNGQLWGIAIGWPANLYKIDKTDASVELVGSTGLTCDYYWQSGGFDQYSGKLYWCGAGFFAEVDTETGVATTIGTTGSSSHGTFCVPFDGGEYFSPVTGVVGAMLYRDGELLGFTTQTSYTDTIATGSHEYEVRVVYDGMRRCPNYNAYYAMSCPLSVGGASYEVTVAANPAQGGVVTGAGSYINGFSCTVTATANENYTFVSWTENNEIVSTDAEYSFTVTGDRSLVANFERTAVTNHWIPDVHQFENGMDIIAQVRVDGEIQNSTLIEVGAFCGDEVRGSGLITCSQMTGKYVVFLRVYGESNDQITFRIYDHNAEVEPAYHIPAKENLVVNGLLGDEINPYIIDCYSHIQQSDDLAEGWNWYSTYIDVEGAEGFGLLTAGLGADADVVKSQVGMSMYYNEYNAWSGSLTTFDNSQMYMIKMNAAHTLEIVGGLTNVAETHLTLHPGWNWVSYPVSVEMPLSDALAEFTPADGDCIKSQVGMAIYYGAYNAWSGSLNRLTPGQGFMYKNNSSSVKVLTYSTESKSVAAANVTADGNHWQPDIHAYADNMNITAVLSVNGEEQTSADMEIGVFCGGECRGSGRVVYNELADRHVIYLTVYGDEGDGLSFRLYDASANVEYPSEADCSLTFAPNLIIGDLFAPYVIDFGCDAVSQNVTTSVSVYPNPVAVGSIIRLGENCDYVRVINSLGMTVGEYTNIDRINGIDIAGAYCLEITKGNTIVYSKIIVE